MKFIKFTVEKEDSTYNNYIPTELWNFTIVTHLIQKIKVEEGQDLQEVGKPAQALVFENSSTMDTVQDLLKEVKHDKTGKVITRKFENKVIQSPYQIVINAEEDVLRFVEWLESNLVK